MYGMIRITIFMAALALLASVVSCKGCMDTRENKALDEAVWYAEQLQGHKGERRAEICAEAIRAEKDAAVTVLDARAQGSDTADAEKRERIAYVAMGISCGWLGTPANKSTDMRLEADDATPAHVPSTNEGRDGGASPFVPGQPTPDGGAPPTHPRDGGANPTDGGVRPIIWRGSIGTSYVNLLPSEVVYVR